MTAVSRCGGRNEPQPGDVPEESIVRYQRTVETKYCRGNPAIAVVGLVAERVAGPPAVGAQLGVRSASRHPAAPRSISRRSVRGAAGATHPNRHAERRNATQRRSGTPVVRGRCRSAPGSDPALDSGASRAASSRPWCRPPRAARLAASRLGQSLLEASPIKIGHVLDYQLVAPGQFGSTVQRIRRLKNLHPRLLRLLHPCHKPSIELAGDRGHDR